MKTHATSPFRILFLLLCVLSLFLLPFSYVCAQEENVVPEKEFEWEPTTPEFRGLWITRFEWPSKESAQCRQNIIDVMQHLADTNFNAAVFQVRGEAETLYPSELEPWSPLIGGKNPGFDPLELAISEAHKHGIQFHAYINPIPLISRRNSQPPEHLYWRHGPEAEDSWVCRDEEGNIMDAGRAQYYYLSPGIPDVQAYIRNVIIDVVRRYDVDGIHLDRIRYPGRQYSHDPVSKRRFYGRGNPNRKEWDDWQREQLDKLVNDLYAEIMAERPEVIVSCAAWGIYNRYHLEGYYHFSSGYHDYYQDTWQWIRLGAMDILMPMIYWDIPDPKPNYDELMKVFAEGVGAERIVGGQRLFTKSPGFQENINEIILTRKLGCPGTVLFAYSRAHSSGLMDELKKTIYQMDVSVPEFSWKTNPDTGIVMGTVVDEAGKPVVDAWISLRPEGNPGEYRRALPFRITWPSGADGRFAFLKVPPVPVKLVVQYDGVQEKVVDGIEVSPGEVQKIVVTLKGVEVAKEQVFFHIFRPDEGAETTQDVVHVLGRTHPGNHIKIGDRHVEVYSTGAFTHDNIPLETGENKIAISASTPDWSTTTTRYLTVIKKEHEREERKVAFEVKEPSANLSLMAGDVLEIRAVGPKGQQGGASCWNGKVKLDLEESTDADGNPTGEYRAMYRIPSGFSAKPSPVSVWLEEEKGLRGFLKKKEHKAESKGIIEVWAESKVLIAQAKEERTGISFGTHYVRLGGPYLSEVPEGTRMEVVGKRGDDYKVRLSASLSGWVSSSEVDLLPEYTPPPRAFFTYCIIDGDEKYDTLWIPLKEKVVFSITPETQPQNCLYIDFFNTHYGTTWFSHKSGAKVMGFVTGEQIEDEWYRLTVPLHCKQIWGWWVERDDNGLTVYIKRPPKIDEVAESPLSGLVFGLEAGHGGRDSGAVGLMGTKEKTINVNAVNALTKALEERGAKVVHMRPGDSQPRFKTRIQYAIDADADFIITVHANAAGSSGGFLRVSGTSTYYKYEHCALPAKLIYDELLKLDWGEFGVVGNFNYAPLRYTEIPAILIEQAFMSNPYDEARLLDPEYQKEQAEVVIKAMEQFIEMVKE